MKTESINKFKLGLFVSIGILLLLGSIYFIGETKKMFSSTFRLHALFSDVKGLQVGNIVRFAGINVGTIDEIEILSDTQVRVDMVLDVKTKKFVKADSKAIIGTDGLMGNKILIISAGTYGQKQIKNNDRIGIIVPISPDDILFKLKITADNSAIITNDLVAIMGNIRNGKGTIGKLFMDTAFAENLDNTIVNVKEGTEGFNESMEAAQKSMLYKRLTRKKKK
jgi:phospholipid/cholesterol/gamma-HCH transport system substrate-binding protein